MFVKIIFRRRYKQVIKGKDFSQASPENSVSTMKLVITNYKYMLITKSKKKLPEVAHLSLKISFHEKRQSRLKNHHPPLFLYS